MIRVAIVEDDGKARSSLRQFVLRYGRETGNEFSIALFEDGEELAEGYRPIYDMIFLDIQMKRMDGLTAAGRIRELDKDVLLIFITNLVQYAIKGYDVNASDFILKPVSYFTFAEHMKRAEAALKRRAKDYLVFHTGNGLRKVDTSLIYYLESSGHRILVHGAEGTFDLADTMKNMERALEGKGFFRCNSGYLVNLEYVEQVSRNVALVGGDEILISRPKKKAFMEALTDYLGGAQVE